MISIIIPITVDQRNLLPDTLNSLSADLNGVEILIPTPDNPQTIADLDENLVVVGSSSADLGTLLNLGAAKAKNDLLLFLVPGVRLPKNGLAELKLDLDLLPQMIGGNFHLKFSGEGILTNLVQARLKGWRYKGKYFLLSGIFVYRPVFDLLQGFPTEVPHPGYQFAQKLEEYGPTTCPPETMKIVAPPPSWQTLLRWWAL